MLDRSEVESIVGVGADWLTVTAVDHDTSAVLADAFHRMTTDLLPSEALPKDWGSMGYKGQSYGPLKFGRRNASEAMLIASGITANDVMLCYEIPHDRVRRLDIQVTVRLTQPAPNIANSLRTRAERLPPSSKYAKMWTYHSSPKGDTFCVGRRGKTVYLRFYDKSVDLGEEDIGRCWRYEVEYRGEAAQKAALNMNRAGDVYRYVSGQVFSEFQKRGVRPLYDVNVPLSAIEVGVKVSSAEAKLGWLSRCVAPVVLQLVDLGYEAEIIDTLSLAAAIRRVQNGTG